MENLIELTHISEDPRFGAITLFLDTANPNAPVMKKELRPVSGQTVNQLSETFNRRMRLNHANLLRIIEVDSQSDSESITIYAEYPENTLEIEKMTSEEKVVMFSDILSGIIHLDKFGMIHGDVRPELITFIEPPKTYKLLERLEAEPNLATVHVGHINDYKHLYLSPRVFNGLMERQIDSSVFNFKADCFALGMVMFGSFGNQSEIQDVYDFDRKQFDVVSFQKILDSIDCPKNDELGKAFLTFLKKSVLIIDDKAQLSPADLVAEATKIPQLSKIINQRNLLSTHLTPIPSPINSRMNSSARIVHYNPFEFIDKDSAHIKRIITSEILAKDSSGNFASKPFTQTNPNNQATLGRPSLLDQSKEYDIDISKFIVTNSQSISNIKNAIIGSNKKEGKSENTRLLSPSPQKRVETDSRTLYGAPSVVSQRNGLTVQSNESSDLFSSQDHKRLESHLPFLSKKESGDKINSYEGDRNEPSKDEVTNALETHNRMAKHLTFEYKDYRPDISPETHRHKEPEKIVTTPKIKADDQLNFRSISQENKAEVEHNFQIHNTFLQQLQKSESNDGLDNYLRSLGIKIDIEPFHELQHILPKAQPSPANQQSRQQNIGINSQTAIINEQSLTQSQRKVKLSEFLRETTKSHREIPQLDSNDQTTEKKSAPSKPTDIKRDSKEKVETSLHFNQGCQDSMLTKNRSTADQSKFGNSNFSVHSNGRKEGLQIETEFDNNNFYSDYGLQRPNGILDSKKAPGKYFKMDVSDLKNSSGTSGMNSPRISNHEADIQKNEKVSAEYSDAKIDDQANKAAIKTSGTFNLIDPKSFAQRHYIQTVTAPLTPLSTQQDHTNPERMLFNARNNQIATNSFNSPKNVITSSPAPEKISLPSQATPVPNPYKNQAEQKAIENKSGSQANSRASSQEANCINSMKNYPKSLFARCDSSLSNPILDTDKILSPPTASPKAKDINPKQTYYVTTDFQKAQEPDVKEVQGQFNLASPKHNQAQKSSKRDQTQTPDKKTQVIKNLEVVPLNGNMDNELNINYLMSPIQDWSQNAKFEASTPKESKNTQYNAQIKTIIPNVNLKLEERLKLVNPSPPSNIKPINPQQVELTQHLLLPAQQRIVMTSGKPNSVVFMPTLQIKAQGTKLPGHPMALDQNLNGQRIIVQNNLPRVHGRDHPINPFPIANSNYQSLSQRLSHKPVLINTIAQPNRQPPNQVQNLPVQHQSAKVIIVQPGPGTQVLDQNSAQVNQKIWRESLQSAPKISTPQKRNVVHSTEKMISSASSIHKEMVSNQTLAQGRQNIVSIDKIQRNNDSQMHMSLGIVEQNRPVIVQRPFVNQRLPNKFNTTHTVNVQNEYFANQDSGNVYGFEAHPRPNSQSKMVYLQPQPHSIEMRMPPISNSTSNFNSMGPQPNMIQMPSSERVIQVLPLPSSGSQLRMSNHMMSVQKPQLIMGKPIQGPALYQVPNPSQSQMQFPPPYAHVAPVPLPMRPMPVNVINQPRFSHQSANLQPQSFQIPLKVFKPN